MKKTIVIIISILITASSIYSTDLNDQLKQLGFSTSENEIKSIDFELSNLEGVKEKLSDYKGKVVFLNFWATWCPPCRGEMPSMENAYKELKDDGFVILAVDLRDEISEVKNFVNEYKLSFPILRDETGMVGGTYNASSIPTTYIIDRNGNILGKAVGGREWDPAA